MKILIIEDETAAAQNLRAILEELAAEVELLAVLESVAEAVDWLRTHPIPDLAFVDIQLADGLSFEIFEQVEATFPVIFTTAYDEYAVQAFTVNSIDYLLKPLDRDAVRASLQKYQQRHAATSPWDAQTMQQLLQTMQQTSPTSYKSSFLVHYRDKLLPIEVGSFAYFYSQSKVVHGMTHDHKTYVLDYTLEELEQQLNPADFYRANRQYVVARRAIIDISFYFNGRLLLNLRPSSDDPVLISKARAPEFKVWMSQ